MVVVVALALAAAARGSGGDGGGEEEGSAVENAGAVRRRLKSHCCPKGTREGKRRTEREKGSNCRKKRCAGRCSVKWTDGGGAIAAQHRRGGEGG